MSVNGRQQEGHDRRWKGGAKIAKLKMGGGKDLESVELSNLLPADGPRHLQPKERQNQRAGKMHPNTADRRRISIAEKGKKNWSTT